MKACCYPLILLFVLLVCRSWQLQDASPSLLITVEGGIRIYPFTQFGPNNQILGTLQALSLCKALNVDCIEPQLSPHTSHASGTARSLSSLYDTSALHLIHLTKRERDPHYILTFLRNGKPCWPGRSYWMNHGLNYSEFADFQNTILLQWNMKRQTVEHETLEALRALQKRAVTQKQTWNVAYVYCDAMVRPIPATPVLKDAFQLFSKALIPAHKYHRVAEEILGGFSLLGKRYAALHIRLKDHCDISFDSCCCYTTGMYRNVTSAKLKAFISELRLDKEIHGVFIAGPPVLKKFIQEWSWAKDLGVHTWFAHNTSLDSAEESIVHQLLCAKAYKFYASVLGSTWSNTVEYWMKNDSLVFDMSNFISAR